MTNTFLFADNAKTTLASPISNTATTISVASGTGALFPNPGAGQQFAITFNDVLTGNKYETCYVTSVSGDNFTVVRGQEGTTAQSWVLGDYVWNGPTSGQMAGMVQIPHMTDGSISPEFGTVTATGNAQFCSSSLAGFMAQNSGGNPTLNLSSGYGLQQIGSFLYLVSGGASYSFDNSGNFTLPGTVNSNKLRAAVGAYNSGDSARAAILSDWYSTSGSGYYWERSPDGFIIQIYGFGLPAQTYGGLFAFPIAFPSACLGICGSFGYQLSSPTAQSTLGLSVANNAQFYATNTGPAGTGTYGTTVIAFGK